MPSASKGVFMATALSAFLLVIPICMLWRQWNVFEEGPVVIHSNCKKYTFFYLFSGILFIWILLRNDKDWNSDVCSDVFRGVKRGVGLLFPIWFVTPSRMYGRFRPNSILFLQCLNVRPPVRIQSKKQRPYGGILFLTKQLSFDCGRMRPECIIDVQRLNAKSARVQFKKES